MAGGLPVKVFTDSETLYYIFRFARHIEPYICHNDHKTYTWNDVILAKRSMIRVFLDSFNETHCISYIRNQTL